MKKKQRFSLRKHKVGAVSVLLGLSIVGGVTIAAGEAKASEVSAIETTTNQDLINQNLNLANEAFDKANSEYSAKKEEVDAKEKEVGIKKGKVSDLEKTAEIGKNITDKTIEDAGNKIEDLEKERIEKTSLLNDEIVKLEEQNKKLSESKDILEKKENVLNNEKENYKQLEDRVSEVTQQIRELKDKQSATKELIANLKKELSNADKDVENKKAELEEAKEFDRILDEKIKKLETEKETQENLIKDINNNLTDAKTELKNAQKTFDEAPRPFEDFDTTMSLDPKFVEVFKRYLNGEVKIEEVIAVEKSLTNKLEYPQSYYYEKEADLIDLTNISKEEEMKMAQYFTHLLNKIRVQFGKDEIQVNLVTQEFANDIAKVIMRDNYSNAGHYVKGIREIASTYGLNNDDNYYENLFTAYMKSKDGISVPRKALYDTIRYMTQGFFYEGVVNGHYLHAKSLLKANDNVGVAFSITTPEDTAYQNYGLKTVKMSVVNVTRNTIEATDNKQQRAIYNEKFSKTSSNTVDLIEVPDYEKMKEDISRVKSKVAEIEEKLSLENKKLSEITLELNKNKSIEKRTEKANSNLEKANKHKEELQNKLNEEDRVLKDLEKRLAEKESEQDVLTKKLSEAKIELDSANKKYEEANKEYKSEKEKQEKIIKSKESLENQLKQLENNIKIAKENKANLEKIKENHEKVLKELETEKKALEKIEAELVKLKEELSKLKAVTDEKYKKYIELKNELERRQELERQRKLEFERELEHQKSQRYEISVSDNKGINTNDKMVGNDFKSLPKTGMDTTSTALIGLVGLVVAARLRKRED